LMMTQ